MDEKKKSKKDLKLEVEAYEAYERIRPIMEEYLDNWMLVGHRCGCGTKVMIGTSHKGWGDMKDIYESVQEWKKRSRHREREA
jgi:hypothetical protein